MGGVRWSGIGWDRVSCSGVGGCRGGLGERLGVSRPEIVGRRALHRYPIHIYTYDTVPVVPSETNNLPHQTATVAIPIDIVRA